MSEVKLRSISSAHPRTFLAADADLSRWEAIEPYFTSLQTREINTAPDVEKWLADLS